MLRPLALRTKSACSVSKPEQSSQYSKTNTCDKYTITTYISDQAIRQKRVPAACLLTDNSRFSQALRPELHEPAIHIPRHGACVRDGRRMEPHMRKCYIYIYI